MPTRPFFEVESLLGSISKVAASFSASDKLLHMEARNSSMTIEVGGRFGGGGVGEEEEDMVERTRGEGSIIYGVEGSKMIISRAG